MFPDAVAGEGQNALNKKSDPWHAKLSEMLTQSKA